MESGTQDKALVEEQRQSELNKKYESILDEYDLKKLGTGKSSKAYLNRMTAQLTREFAIPFRPIPKPRAVVLK